ncbi:MAG TPA: FixH family protein [Nitrospirota bacterium]
MKRHFTSVLIAVTAAAALFGCAKSYESQKSADDLKITLSVERYPLVKGDNALAVKVSDSFGNPVADATVTVRYFMPPMPGMAPMDYNTQAMLKGGVYVFSANIPMEGGWKAEVSVARPGKPAVSATFNVDAR